MEGLDDLDDQPDDGGRREELAALLPFCHRELAQEVLVDLAEGVAFEVHRVEQLDQFDENLFGTSW